MTGGTFMVVDDDGLELQIIRDLLEDGGYRVITVTGGRQALDFLETDSRTIDAIILDVMMPGMSGYEICERLKSNPATRKIPVIFLTARIDAEDEARGFDVGAVEYIYKPVFGPILLRRMQALLSLARTQDLEDSHKEMVSMLGEAGHYNDNDTGVHIWRMAAYASALAAAAAWPDPMVKRMGLAAPMHDTGKIGIPDAILKAPRKLTAEEWVVMKRHTEIGFDILSKARSPVFAMAAEIARHHHEKWDGSGYPDGLAGDAISQSARIVAIADVFDALTMKRPYKEPWSVEDSMAEIRRGAGTQFEPILVDLFEGIQPEILAIKRSMESP